MASYNRVMNLWHAYKRIDGRRVHLGYYNTEADADEANKLGERTDKCVCTRTRRAEKKSDTTVANLVSRLKQEGQS